MAIRSQNVDTTQLQMHKSRNSGKDMWRQPQPV